MLWQPTRGILQAGQHWHRPTEAGGGALGLQTNLSAFWELENTSWTDALGVNALTGTNSPTSVTGKVGNAVKFTSGSSQLVSHTDHVNLSPNGGSFSLQCWVNLVSGTGLNNSGIIMCKGIASFNSTEFGVGTEFDGSSQKWSWIFDDTGGNTNKLFSSVTATSGWHQLVMTWDGSTQKIYVDGSAAGSQAVGFANITERAGAFNIGVSLAGVSASASQDVLIDQVGLWKARVLSAANVTALYNSGSGLSYAAMA